MSGDDSDNVCVPTVLWAQNMKEIFITVNLADVSDKKIEILPQKFTFRGKSGSPKPLQYAISFDLFGLIDPDSAKDISTDRIISYKILKKDSKAWPTFLQNMSKPFWLKTDFAHFVDVDESDSEIEGFGSNDQSFQDMMSMMGENNDLGDYYDDGGNDADADSDDNDVGDPVKSNGINMDKISEENADKLEKEKVEPDSSTNVSKQPVNAQETVCVSDHSKLESTEDTVDEVKIPPEPESAKAAKKNDTPKQKNKGRSKGHRKSKA